MRIQNKSNRSEGGPGWRRLWARVGSEEKREEMRQQILREQQEALARAREEELETRAPKLDSK